MEDTPFLSGKLSEDKAKALVGSLYLLTKVGVEKVILEFSILNDVKTLYINALNTTGTVFVRVKYDPSFLDGFDLKETFKYGISKLQDFVSMLDMFKTGFEIKMAPEIASISAEDNYLDYYGAEPSKIKRGEDGDIDSVVVSSFAVDPTFKTFITAIGKVEQNHVIFKGTKNDTESFIILSVADKDVRGNIFTRKVITPVQENFRISINKEYFSSVLTPGTNINIYREVIKLSKKDPLYNMEYFITTLL